MLAIASVWCLSLILVNPFGNFPFGDDFSYCRTVKRLIETGDFRPTGWTAIPLITHALWGALFCIPTGFSFNAVRLSTLAASLLGTLGAYLLMRSVCSRRGMAVIVALTLAFNPIYYFLSNTFMTDVLYTAMTIFAAIFFLRSLKGGSNLDFFIGTTLAVAATLSRQLGLAVPLAFGVALILKRGMRIGNIVRAAIPPTLCIGALFGFQHWLAATGRVPGHYFDENNALLGVLIDPDPGRLIRVLANDTYVVLLYLGWFLSPVLLFALASVWRGQIKKAMLIFSASMGGIVVLGGARALFGRSPLMPASKDIINNWGIGPFTLRDTYILNQPMPVLPAGFWWVITALSLAGAALLLTAIGLGIVNLGQKARLFKMNDSEAAGVFLLLSAVIYLAPFMMAGYTLDRYLVPIMALVAAGMASLSLPSTPDDAKGNRLVGAALLGMLALFAICGTRDNLAWNRARWAALDDLMEKQHVKAADIDGGFEFDGFYLYDSMYKKDPTKSWWWVQGDTYEVAFRPLAGYTPIKEYNFSHWMPPYAGKVLVLRKNAP
jgi:4-amino-4-deoxy-L-arabinose transferase-like glycosyltransferase